MNKLKLANTLIKKLNLGTELRRKSKVNDKNSQKFKPKHVKGGKLLSDREQLLKELPGEAKGEFSRKILETCNPEKFYLIGTWNSKRYDDEMYQDVKERFQQDIKQNKVKIKRQRSTKALKEFENNYFDWIYIDTTHSYKQTKKELEKASKKVKEGGYIAGHDYARSNSKLETSYGVIPAVKEFCIKYNWRMKTITMEDKINPSFVLGEIQ